jgi:amino acid transporter
MGDLGTSYIASWVGDVITLGATISAFGCCLACMIGASRLLFAMNRDVVGAERGLSRVSRQGTPAAAALVVTFLMVLIQVIMGICGHAEIFTATFAWSGTIGTLILLVVYVVTTVGAIWLVFVRRRMPVPQWQVIIPVLAIVVLGYTIYRNVVPWPTTLAGRALPITAGAWIALCVVAVLLLPNVARRLGRQLAAEEGFATEMGAAPPKRLADA